jgi:hypothetical protein
VAVNDVSSNIASLLQVVQEIENMNVEAIACIADVSVENEVRDMIDQVIAHFPTGRLDVVSAFFLLWNALSIISRIADGCKCRSGKVESTC